MAYSTGSGTYIDLMAAVLAHAIGDGWTEVGGVGTGWPITKGDLFVDWDSYQQTETDQTGGLSGSKVQRFLRIGIGVDAVSATAQAASTTNVVCPNAAYQMTEYHIFSDPSVSDHIHVVFVFSNGVDPQVCSHFSFGQIDKLGMSHGGISYATTRNVRGYALDSGNDTANNADEWNSLVRCKHIFAGSVGDDALEDEHSIEFIVHSTDAPAPNGGAGWPLHDTIVGAGQKLWGKIGTMGDQSNTLIKDTADTNMSVTWNSWTWSQQPYSGGVSLLHLPFLMINGTTEGSKLRYCGQFPNVRTCSMANLLVGDEIVYAGETWKVFPLICKKNNLTLGLANTVTSGLAGLAYKKVS